jgi:hypothetical protein
VSGLNLIASCCALSRLRFAERPHNLRFRISGLEMQEWFDFEILYAVSFPSY